MKAATAIKKFMTEQYQQSTDASVRKSCQEKIAECDALLQRQQARYTRQLALAGLLPHVDIDFEAVKQVFDMDAVQQFIMTPLPALTFDIQQLMTPLPTLTFDFGKLHKTS